MSAVIGSRWQPGYVERRDSQSGHYEAINSRMDHRAEIEVQRALLAPVRSRTVAKRIAEAMAARKTNLKGSNE